MIAVIDAAAVVDLLCGFAPALRVEAALRSSPELVAPAHIDAEAFSALARLHRAGELPDAAQRIELLAAFPLRRLPIPPLLARAWALRSTIAARDALYVALAIELQALFITTDERLRRATRGLVELVDLKPG